MNTVEYSTVVRKRELTIDRDCESNEYSEKTVSCLVISYERERGTLTGHDLWVPLESTVFCGQVGGPRQSAPTAAAPTPTPCNTTTAATKVPQLQGRYDISFFSPESTVHQS